jgi:hypothetical protein
VQRRQPWVTVILHNLVPHGFVPFVNIIIIKNTYIKKISSKYQAFYFLCGSVLFRHISSATVVPKLGVVSTLHSYFFDETSCSL